MNGSWKQVACRGFILGVDLSLQMAMMGTLLFLMRALRAPTPPRSPADMPSTSSMMMIDLRLTPRPSFYSMEKSQR